MREKIMNSRLFRSKIDMGRDLANAKSTENQMRFGNLMGLGQATAPIAFNPGGTNVSRTPYSVYDWLGLGLQAASGAAGLKTAFG